MPPLTRGAPLEPEAQAAIDRARESVAPEVAKILARAERAALARKHDLEQITDPVLRASVIREGRL